jgi:hypothetical protein
MKRMTVPAVLSLALILGILPTHVATGQTRLALHVAAGASRSSVLYRSTFGTTGLRGWHINGVWHAGSDGVAGVIGSNSGEILAPFSVTRLRNFRVTASIRAVGPPGNPPYPETQSYGLDLRARVGKSGVRGGTFLSLPYAGPGLGWSDQRALGNDITLHHGFNIFRIDVHGTDYTLWINGAQIVQFPIVRSSAGTRVGVWTDHRKIDVKNFMVTRLGDAVPLKTAPPMKALSLGRSDIPRGLQAEGGYYSTPEAIAREWSQSIDMIRERGEILAYTTLYGQGSDGPPLATFLEVTITAYSSITFAQKGLIDALPGSDTPGPAYGDWVVTDLRGLGDGASLLSYNFQGLTDIFVYLRRGPYVVTLGSIFVEGSVAHSEMVNQAAALATIIDRHIKKAGHSHSP